MLSSSLFTWTLFLRVSIWKYIAVIDLFSHNVKYGIATWLYSCWTTGMNGLVGIYSLCNNSLTTLPKLWGFTRCSWSVPSSETQGSWGSRGGQVYKNERGTPGILLLTDQFRNHLKSWSPVRHLFTGPPRAGEFATERRTMKPKKSPNLACL